MIVNSTVGGFHWVSSEPVISSCTAAGGGRAMIQMPCCDASKVHDVCLVAVTLRRLRPFYPSCSYQLGLSVSQVS